MRAKQPDGTWPTTATVARPLRMRLPDGTFRYFAGGDGPPLYKKMPDGTWQVVATGGDPAPGSVQEIPQTFRLLLRLNAPTGWYASERHEATDRPGVDPVDRTDAAPLTPGGLLANSVSGSGWTGDEWGYHYNFLTEQAAWYRVPIAALKQFVMEVVASNAPGQVQYGLTDPVLTRIEVAAALYGSSVIKSQVPWMSHYYWGDTTVGAYNGVGAFVYQGPADTPTEDYQWATTRDTRTVALPVVRGKVFAREGGTTLWTGPLNELGSAEHGFSRPPLVVTHTLPGTFGAQSAQYHLNVSAAPAPPPITPYVDSSTDNSMRLDITVTFVIAYTYIPPD